MAGQADWRIMGDERSKHDAQFFQLKPVNGFITGEQAKGFFMQSGLPTPVLGLIWNLADINNDGKMDKKEFSIAMHLIKKKLQGYELPKTLPHTLKADPSPVIGSFGTPQPMAPSMGMGMRMGIAPGPRMAIAPGLVQAPGMAPGMSHMGIMGPGGAHMAMQQGMHNGLPQAGYATMPAGFGAAQQPGFGPGKPATDPYGTGVRPAGDWSMLHPNKLRYTQVFNMHDRNKRGFLTGVEARALFMQSGLPQPILAQIWTLSDIDNDGKLTCDEFCISMHLTEQAKAGRPLPPKLPQELVPASLKSRTPSFSGPVMGFQPAAHSQPQMQMPAAPKQPESFGDLLGNMGMPPPMPVQLQPASDEAPQGPADVSPATFEDRRKQNFDKGQAELDRRRKELQDQLKREEEARQEKDRKEAEKREQQRLERERKKQLEMEKHLERQRAVEREREEQRQKMMEQREAARREVERQRQMEWERQRKEQLMAEKVREYQQLETQKAQTNNLKCELEALDGKKTEIATKVNQVRTGVNEITSTIERMRQSRDLKLSDIERFQVQLQELSQKYLRLQSSREQTSIQVQTTIQNNPLADTQRTVQHSVDHKKTTIQKLKAELEEIERTTATRLNDIDESNRQLKEFNVRIASTESSIKQAQNKQKDVNRNQQQDTPNKLKRELETQRIKDIGMKRDPSKTGTQKGDKPSAWFDDAFDKASTMPSGGVVNDVWGSAFSGMSTTTTTTTTTASSKDNWADAFSSGASQPNSAAKPVVQKTMSLSGDQTKYKALYHFEARNPDEISLNPGDIILVGTDQSGAEPGWMGGEKEGKFGWFPQAYVETTSSSANLDISNYEDVEATQNADGSQAGGFLPTSIDSSFTAIQAKLPDMSPTPGQGQTAPDGLLAQALYPWKAKKENHLTFNRGDVISVKEQQDMWWSGELDGRVGWFPKSYVKLIGGPTAAVKKTSTPTESLPVTTETIEDRSTLSSTLDRKSDVQGEYYVAMYTYTSGEPTDLTFDEGEVIVVKNAEGDWWMGSIGERTGIFPANYVKKTELQRVEVVGSGTPESSQPTQSLMEDKVSDMASDMSTNMAADISTNMAADMSTNLATDMSTDLATVFSNNTAADMSTCMAADMSTNMAVDLAAVDKAPENAEVKPPDQLLVFPTGLHVQPGQITKTNKKPEIASVIATYTATGPEQLSLSPGQLISVRKKSPSGWWEGELQARGQKRKIGWFPANYVKLLGSSARSTPDAQQTLSQSPLTTSQEQKSSSVSTTPTPAQPTQDAHIVEQVIALYPYEAQNGDELTFHKDSVINVLSKEDSNWWKGEINGTVGMFPMNYVGPLAGNAESNATESESYTGTALDSQGEERQRLIAELISTEETYMEDLSLVLEVFAKPMGDAKVLSPEELQAIFVNWQDLIMCNMKLIKAMRVRKKMCGNPHNIQIIGDILCENLPHMTAYIRFCSVQLNAAALLQHKTQDPEFKEVHRQCIQDSRTKNMPLSSFLLKPMQRITRYRLLIQKILGATPESHADHQNLVDALCHSEELCSQVNEGVRERDNSDKLEWIQQHVQCEGLPEKIVFNSVTNCLGPRKFVYSGTLYKIKSNKELVAFLFNDFLILSQPIRPLGSVVKVFSFDPKGTTQYRMYRTPIFLNEIVVKKPPDTEPDPCVFQLSHIDRVYSLKTVSAVERENWMKHIDGASKTYIETDKKKRERVHSTRRIAGVGRLLVVIQEGCDLKKSDENGKSDPYCEVNMGTQEHRTKVINKTLNPKWNTSMQFTIKDLGQDVLCITVFDHDLFSPNDFLGRTEVRIADIMVESREKKGPLTKRLLLHEVDCGEVVVKLDLQLYKPT